MNPEGAPPPASRLQRWLLGLLLVWSFAVRLVFSWPDPTMNRIWDERYNAGNVAAILAEGQFQPVRAHYPTLSYMPHALLLKTWEAARSLPGLRAAPSAVAMAPQGRPFLTPFGVRACRFLQVVVGTASLWVLYLIGRRLFGPGAALTAVLLLSVTPWHLRQSGAFKPDIMMVLASVVALYAMLAARNPGGASPRHQRHSPSARLRALGCQNGSLKSFAVAGAMVGATAAAKWNGGALVIPLLATIALGGIRDVGLVVRRTAAAGAAAVGVLVLLNPWLLLVPDLYRRHLSSTVTQYQERLAVAGSGWFDQPLSVVTSLASGVYFSPILGALALLGLAWLLVLVLRTRTASAPLPGAGGSATVGDAWILLFFSGGYVAALWAATRYPKPPNWLIVAPVAALAAAWLIHRVLGSARTAHPVWVRRTAVPALVLVFAGAFAAKAHFVHRTVHDENVPLTVDEAARVAGARKPLRGRTFITELPLGAQAFDPRTWESAFVPTVIRTDDLAEGLAVEPRMADVLLFAASRLAPDQHPAHRELAAADGAQVQRFEPGLFRLRGEPVVLVRQPFQAVGPPAPAPFAMAGEGAYSVDLSSLAGSVDGRLASLVSLEIAIRTPSRDTVDVTVEIDGDPLPCRPTQKGRERRRCLTPRLPLSSTPVDVRVAPAREVIQVTVFRWRRPD
ncbi:MAG: glycosyltransferase family 39 protein [Acidobacteria bacterium]|nr:glycosyltransferase family 39 protein [Acidobacteriota bacterium]